MAMIEAIKKAVQAFWMLAGLVMLCAWIAFGGWLLLWIGSSAVHATWAPAVGSWGYDFFIQHFWVKLLSILAFLTLIGAICGETPSRRTKCDTNFEAERKREEEMRILADETIIGQRNLSAAQSVWERSAGLR
jgi:membrane protein implicated in regulation of membrane protease activity